MSAPAKLGIEHLTHRFTIGSKGAPLLVLDDVSLAVGAGEIVCLVGAVRLRQVDAAATSWPACGADEGRVCSTASPYRPGLNRGIVFQQYALFPWRTALGQRRVRPRRAGARGADRERARGMLDIVGLERLGTGTRTSSRAACASASPSPGPRARARRAADGRAVRRARRADRA